MKLKELIMDSKILTIKEKLILIDTIKKGKINNEQLKGIIKNLISSKDIIDKELENWIKEIQTEYVKSMEKKLPTIRTKVVKIKLNTKETIVKQDEWDPEELLKLI